MLDLDFDRSSKPFANAVICGCDEAGRGPLAGPVVAAACILPEGYVPEGLDDSKKLTEKKREKLYAEITKNAVAWCAAEASPAEIDEINILEASLLAMRRAVAGLGVPVDFILVDGNIYRGFDKPGKAVIGGDSISPSIAAASIIAKVTRDRMCADMHEAYPEYNFAKHKGYPTKDHKLAVYEHGPCPIHRRSFLSFLERDRDKLEAALAEKRAKEN
ncbi:MAG: ribonuclease HII [Ruminococcaceae bacterium]|nr:ribonuclease HII [Oscillospiraceae bacterium]